MSNSIKKFNTKIVDKQDGNKRTCSTQSLYVLLGHNIFHQNLTAFVHDFVETVEVVFYELGFKRNPWVETQAYHLMFKENEVSAEISINETLFGGHLKKLLGHLENKLIYI